METSLKMNFALRKRDLLFKKERDMCDVKSKSVSCCAKELPMQYKKNLYQVLSLESQNVSSVELKKAYHAKALQLHPDVCPSSIREECTKQFVELRKAYEVLSDPNSRRMYDNELSLVESFGCGFGGHGFDEQKGYVPRKVWEMQLGGLKRLSADRMERMKNGFVHNNF